MGYFKNLTHMTQGTKNSYSDKIGNIEMQIMIIHESELTDKQVTGEKICIITKSTVTLPQHHISIVLLTSINYSNKIHTDTLLEMEDNPFFTIEQTNVTIIPALQKLENRTPDKFMAILWNPGVGSKRIKRNTTISYKKDSYYIEKSPSE